MSWRTVVVTKSSKLDYSMGYLVMRDASETVKVHISEISILIIETTAVSLTTALLSELVKKKVKVIFCDEKRNPQSELTPYYGSHDCSQRLKKQMGWSDEAKGVVWTAIVAQKINNQALLLEKFGLEEHLMLKQYIEELEFGDSSNREGHAAKVYFNALFGKEFKRGDETGQNAALNYGYSIILSAFNREVVCSGYLTQLGLFHDNMFNQYNLSCDLMEPFRPLIDCEVKKNGMNELGSEEKAKLVSVLNNEVIINEMKNTVLNAIKIYCKSVFNAIENEDVGLIDFPILNYEL